MLRGFCALAALCALLALASLAGCQKKTLSETATSPSIKELKQNPTEAPADLDKAEDMAAGILEPPRLALPALHDTFMKLGPKLGYTYVPAGDMLSGDKLPTGSMAINELITQYYQVYGKGGDVNDPQYRNTTIENYLQKPVFPVATQEEIAQQAQAEAKVEQAEAAGLPWQEKLSIASEPVGDWHSFKEVREGDDNYRVDHDEKYYKNLSIQAGDKPDGLFDGKALLQEYRDGKIENKYEQPYRYDAEKGELTMISDEGTPMLTLVLRQMAGETDILYVKTQYDFVYTVYERIGSGGAANDLSEAEKKKREFEESGGGTAHGGAKGGGAAEGGK